MKKEFAVFVDIEGIAPGRISLLGEDWNLEQEDMTLRGSEGYRELKICNIQVDLPFDDVTSLIATGHDLIRDDARKAIEAKEAELAAMKEAFKSNHQAA